MLAYASRTGSSRNLEALRCFGWRLLVSMEGVWRTEGFRYMLDNGAWSCYQSGKKWNSSRYRDFYDILGAGADLIVVPDIVCGGVESLRLSESWLPRLDGHLLVPVQDGISPAAVKPLLGSRCGIFLGGSTHWKLLTIQVWGDLAEEMGCWYHVARVNSKKRIGLADYAGADSFDGSGASRYAKATKTLSKALANPCLDWRVNRARL